MMSEKAVADCNMLKLSLQKAVIFGSNSVGGPNKELEE
jgi:hypothetical protein